MMNRYKSNGIAKVTGGVVEMEESQSRRRLHKLNHLGGKRFEVMKTIQFKQGEVFGYEGNLKDQPVELLNPEKPAKKKTFKTTE